MARLDVGQIRKALADTCAPVVSNATAYRPKTINSFPAVWVDQPEIRRRTFAAEANFEIEIEVVLAVAANWDRAAQERIDDLLVDLWEVLAADPTLGGIVQPSNVDRFVPVPETDEREWVGGIFEMRIAQTATLTT